MRVLVCGARHWTDARAIGLCLAKLPVGTVIVEGEARGADLLGRAEAEKLGFAVDPHPAEWARYGRAAGPIRNQGWWPLASTWRSCSMRT